MRLQRQQHLHVAALSGGVDVQLHARQHLRDGLVVHSGAGNGGILGILIVHGLKHGNLLNGLVDPLLFQILRVLNLLVRLSLCLRQLGVLVGLGVVDHGLGLLLGGFHRLEGLDNLLRGRFGVLNLHVHQGQADVVLLQDLRDQLLDLHLDVLLAIGQNGVHAGGAHHVADLALDQVAQNQLRIVGGVQVLHRIGDLVLHKEIHVDDVVVAGDHGALPVIDLVAASGAGVAQLDFLVDVHVHLVHLLNAEGQLEVDAGIGDVRHLAEGGDHRLLLVVHGVEAGASQGQQDQRQRHHEDGASDPLEVRLFLGLLGLVSGPAVGSVFIHWFVLLFKLLSTRTAFAPFRPSGDRSSRR